MPTSYAALITRANLQAGEWVLIHAAAGGVGLAAVQIAKARGATVIATAGTEEKLEIAKKYGADFGVCYRENEDWPKEVLKIRPKGVDIVFDPVGLISPSQKCIAWNGRLVIVGFAGGPIEKIATNRILLKNISVVGIHWGAYAKFEPKKIEEVWRELLKLMDGKKWIRPTNFTDKVYRGLEDVPRALEALGGRETWGKVVVDLPEGRESRI